MTPERYTSVYVSSSRDTCEFADSISLGFSLISSPAAEPTVDFTSRTRVLPATSSSEEYQRDMEGFGGMEPGLYVGPQFSPVDADCEEAMLVE